jgi:hypothetical protein
VAEVAHSHANVDDPIGLRCRRPVEDCVIRNSLQVVAARATGQVNCPSRNEWARDNIRPGHKSRPSPGDVELPARADSSGAKDDPARFRVGARAWARESAGAGLSRRIHLWAWAGGCGRAISRHGMWRARVSAPRRRVHRAAPGHRAPPGHREAFVNAWTSWRRPTASPSRRRWEASSAADPAWSICRCPFAA